MQVQFARDTYYILNNQSNNQASAHYALSVFLVSTLSGRLLSKILRLFKWHPNLSSYDIPITIDYDATLNIRSGHTIRHKLFGLAQLLVSNSCKPRDHNKRSCHECLDGAHVGIRCTNSSVTTPLANHHGVKRNL